MLLEVHKPLLIVHIALDNRDEPAVGDALQEEILQDVVVPNEIWLFHQVARVGLICLLASQQLLLAYTEVRVVREVKSRALRTLASNVEELFEVFFCP